MAAAAAAAVAAALSVEFIATKLLAVLETAGDVYLRTDLVTRITSAAERFAPSNSWCVAALRFFTPLSRPPPGVKLTRCLPRDDGR